MRKGLILLLIAILLAGCAGAAQSTTTGKGPVDDQTSPTPGGVSQPTPDQGAPVIIMEKSGGLAGVHQKWALYASGQVVSAGQVIRLVTADQVKAALADIRKAGFYDLQADYRQASTCNDCFLYTVSVNSGGNSKTVTGVDGDAHTPAEFLQVVSEILNLVSP